MECVRLRVKDLDFAQRQIVVHDGKEAEDWVTMLPNVLIPPLQEHLRHVKRIHEGDLAKGYGSVYLPFDGAQDRPFALERKHPHASQEWIWQYVFPASKLSKDPRTGAIRRATMSMKAACRRLLEKPSWRIHLPESSNATSFAKILVMRQILAYRQPTFSFREGSLSSYRYAFVGEWLRYPHCAVTPRP